MPKKCWADEWYFSIKTKKMKIFDTGIYENTLPTLHTPRITFCGVFDFEERIFIGKCLTHNFDSGLLPNVQIMTTYANGILLKDLKSLKRAAAFALCVFDAFDHK